MKTALLVIDAQQVYTTAGSELHCADSTSTIDKINSLIHHFESAGEPVFLIRHIHKQDRSDLGRMFDYLGDDVEDFNFKEGTSEVEFEPRLHRPEKAWEIRKTRYSAFVDTDLDARLKTLGVKRVVVCGFMTNCCCDATARDAHARDYFVDFVTDATGTPGTDNYDENQVRTFTADLMEAAFARVVTAKDRISE